MSPDEKSDSNEGTGFSHQRHKPPTPLLQPRELIVACAPMSSHVNLSRIMRTAGCCGITKVIGCGAARVIGRIARDGADAVELEVHRTLPPVLKELKRQDYVLIGLEQTTASQRLYDFDFPRRCVLVVGNERLGLTDDILPLLHYVVEIPVYGMPFAHNVATATAMALYEYCRQYPNG